MNPDELNRFQDHLPRLLRTRWRSMAESDADPLVREMAAGLLDGSIASPGEALRYGPYREAFHERLEGFFEARANLTDGERERLEAQAGQIVLAAMNDLEEQDRIAR